MKEKVEYVKLDGKVMKANSRQVEKYIVKEMDRGRSFRDVVKEIKDSIFTK